jgi:cytochrome P450
VIQLDDSFTADPHVLYELLRQERPVTQARMPLGMRIWLVTRYDDVRAALVDPRLAKDSSGLNEIFERRTHDAQHRARLSQELSAHMLNSDPPDHTRLRKLVSRGFTARAIGRLRPRIEQIAAELTEAMAAPGGGRVGCGRGRRRPDRRLRVPAADDRDLRDPRGAR